MQYAMSEQYVLVFGRIRMQYSGRTANTTAVAITVYHSCHCCGHLRRPAPFTRYNLLSNRLSNRLTTGCIV